MWRSTFQNGAAQLRFVTEIALKSPFLFVNRSPIRCSFLAGARTILTSSSTRPQPYVMLPIRQQPSDNRQFPCSKKSHFQSEAKCEAVDMKMIFNYDANKTHFHNKGFALSLVLKVRFFGTRKWSIAVHILSYFPTFTIWTLQIWARNLQQSKKTFQLRSSAVISFSIAHSVILYFNSWENWFSKPKKKKQIKTPKMEKTELQFLLGAARPYVFFCVNFSIMEWIISAFPSVRHAHTNLKKI